MKIISILLLTIILFLGCASTKIRSTDPYAEIYMDENFLGVGEVSVDRVGPPRQVHLVAKRDGLILGQASMRRNFSYMTIVWGLCSYYTGFYWGWYFPEAIKIETIGSFNKRENTTNLWVNPSQSIWMRPLSGYVPKKLP